MNVQNFVLAAVMAAAFLSAWAADEVDGGGLSATVHPCKQPEYRDKVIIIGSKTPHPRQVDCREWNRKREPDSADIYSCDYDSADKFCRSLYGSGPGDTRVNAIIDNSLPLKNGNAALTCEIRGPGFYDVQYKTKFYYHNGCDKPKPDDGDKPDNSELKKILNQLNDTLGSLNKTIGGLGGSGGGKGGGAGASGKGDGGGKGDGSAGGKGDGNGKGDGKGNGEGVGSGEDMPAFSADNGDIKQREPFDLGGFSVTGYFTSSGSCPAPAVVDLGVFGRMLMTYDWLCRLEGLIRPVAIAFAWLSALMIIVKGSRRT